MNSIAKIALAAVLAYTVQGRGSSNASRGVGRKSRMGPAPFDEDQAWFTGKCMLMHEGERAGLVLFHQELTDAAELEPTTLTVRARGAAANRVAIELYEEDPAENANAQLLDTFAELRPNKRGVASVYGLETPDATLQGEDSLENRFIGVRCAQSGNLIGTCQVRVTEDGDHGDDEDDADLN